MYLVEALRHDVPAFHEDRLTQIVAATFNKSTIFQKLLFSFLNVPFRPSANARTQVSNERAPSRPDLIIFQRERPYVLVESKVEAKVRLSQQQLHSRLKANYNFLFVRDPVVEIHVSKNFTKVTWFDFFSYLHGGYPIKL